MKTRRVWSGDWETFSRLECLEANWSEVSECLCKPEFHYITLHQKAWTERGGETSAELSSCDHFAPGNPWKVTRSPGWAPLGGSRISTLSGVLAHMTMAWDTIPLILTGLRLHRNTAMRFCICWYNVKRVIGAKRRLRIRFLSTLPGWKEKKKGSSRLFFASKMGSTFCCKVLHRTFEGK